MHTNISARTAAGAIAVLSLALLAPTAATAAGPEPTDSATPEVTATPTEPAPTATPTEPAPTATPTEPAPTATPAPADDIPYPPAEDAGGLVDLKLPDRTVPVDPLPDPQYGPLANYYTLNLGKTGKTSPPGDLYDGSAVGLYFEADVLGLLKVKSRKLGAVYVPKPQTKSGGSDQAVVATTHPELWPLPYVQARGIESKAQSYGICCSYSRPGAVATTKIARLELADLVADGIEVTATTQKDSPTGLFETTADVRIARLKLGTTTYNYPDIAPNTTYNLAGLGKVVLNEKKITRIAGNRYAAKVNAIHITLGTAKLGLPVGTDIYIGSAEAVVFDK